VNRKESEADVVTLLAVFTGGLCMTEAGTIAFNFEHGLSLKWLEMVRVKHTLVAVTARNQNDDFARAVQIESNNVPDIFYLSVFSRLSQRINFNDCSNKKLCESLLIVINHGQLPRSP